MSPTVCANNGKRLTFAWAVYRIDQYIPDALYESYETVRDALLVWLIRFGLIGKTATQDSTLDAPRESRPFSPSFLLS